MFNREPKLRSVTKILLYILDCFYIYYKMKKELELNQRQKYFIYLHWLICVKFGKFHYFLVKFGIFWQSSSYVTFNGEPKLRSVTKILLHILDCFDIYYKMKKELELNQRQKYFIYLHEYVLNLDYFTIVIFIIVNSPFIWFLEKFLK